MFYIALFDKGDVHLGWQDEERIYIQIVIVVMAMYLTFLHFIIRCLALLTKSFLKRQKAQPIVGHTSHNIFPKILLLGNFIKKCY